MRFRDSAAVIFAAFTTIAASGCIDGKSRDIPPAPTAAPPGSAVFVYVAQARDPQLGTDGGAVAVYRLGSDGLLPGGPPEAIQTVVNPRRLARHPELPVLYVASANQVLAFDITGGALVSLCGPGGGIAPPCATEARPGSNPVDLKFLRNDAGSYLLYVVEQGGGSNLDTPTRLSAYELGANGELPSLPSSQAVTLDATFYQGAAITPQFAYVGDVGIGTIVRFPLQSDGNLPDVPPTPSPLIPTPVPPDPTPEPTPSPEPSPSPTAWRARAPGRFIQASADVAGAEQTVLYIVQQGRRRISSTPVDAFGNLPENPTSESETRGIYNSIVVDQFASPTRIYGAAFQNGQVDSFAIEPDGNIVSDSLSATFANTSSYPTGVALLDSTPVGGAPTRTLFVSLGGFDRVDAYALDADGTIAELPFSSTEPMTDTFPSDVLVYVAE
jgi:hypothetical protein